MFFNSIEYLLFLPLVFIIYWGILRRTIKGQNVFLLIASYVFYGWWDYRFLALIALSTGVDYFISIAISKQSKKSRRKLLLGISLAFNFGLLGFFKYYNFFIESWIDSWAALGVSMHASTLYIILPVGISFYTFQTLSYTIDVYRKKLEPTQNFINFAAYVAFFPQLVAGPIERATQLLPQFAVKRNFNADQAISGIHLIIWGLFKKVVIADNCATYVNAIFNNYETMNTTSLMMGAVYFAFQIYGDFSGYSDIAIGTSRLFGFNLMKNFNYPYFSRNIAEFWRRWHISLSTWFRDYLYIPLGGSRGSKQQQIRNVAIIFLVSSFWHGADWTFIVWGGLHALYYIPVMWFNNHRNYMEEVAQNKWLPNCKEALKIVLTFILVTITWVFFRADSVTIAVDYLKRMFTNLSFNTQYLNIERYSIELGTLIAVFLVFEWFHRTSEHPFFGKLKWAKLVTILLMLLTLGVYSEHQNFIYFQF